MIKKNIGILMLAAALLTSETASYASGGAGNPADEALRRLVRASGIAPEAVALWVAKAGSPTPIAAMNETKSMAPASVMKVLTTAAALERLGPAWTTTTRFAASAPPDAAGRIQGATLVGGGDAHLVVQDVWLLVQALRQAGVKSIAGDIVIDRSRYDESVSVRDQGRFDGEAFRPYNVGPDAASLNFKTLSLTIAPDGRITTIPVLAGVSVPARAPVTKGACGDWKRTLEPVFDGRRLRFKGRYPAACGTKTLHYSQWDADFYATALLKPLLNEAGIRWRGRVRPGEAPADSVTLAALPSAPLASTVTWINKFSNNTMARHLFLELGLTDADGTRRPATLERSRAVMSTWLAGCGVDPESVRVGNGSGLARESRLTAQALGRVLSAVWGRSYLPELMASLPSAGVDGTMRHRATPWGSAHVKTGYLKNVRSLAGYVTTVTGERLVLVMLVNGRCDPEASKKLGDELIAWAGRRGSDAP